MNKGTCAITTNDIETSIVNTNNGTYVIASEADRNNALRDAAAEESSKDSGSGSASAYGSDSASGCTRPTCRPADHANAPANRTAAHHTSLSTIRIADQFNGMMSKFNGLLTHLNDLIGHILPCAAHESGTQHPVCAAAHLTDEIKGPMSHATAVTRQGRQDENHKGFNDTSMQDGEYELK